MCLDCADTQDAMVKAHKSKFREEFPLGKCCESRLANFSGICSSRMCCALAFVLLRCTDARAEKGRGRAYEGKVSRSDSRDRGEGCGR